jgi:hypothetical protein
MQPLHSRRPKKIQRRRKPKPLILQLARQITLQLARQVAVVHVIKDHLPLPGSDPVRSPPPPPPRRNGARVGILVSTFTTFLSSCIPPTKPQLQREAQPRPPAAVSQTMNQIS